jgi:hypothetical protein
VLKGDTLPSWVTDPEVAFAIGVIGLILGVVGVVLTVRANRQSRADLSKLRNLIVEGVADVIGSRQSHAPINAQAATRPTDPEVPPGGPAARLPEPKRVGLPAGDLDSPQAKVGEYAGTANLTHAGSADLVVEQVGDGQANLKVFSWDDLDLVLVAELSNNSGAHFQIHDGEPAEVATLGLQEGLLVERRWTWKNNTFEEHAAATPGDPGAFTPTPDWLS